MRKTPKVVGERHKLSTVQVLAARVPRPLRPLLGSLCVRLSYARVHSSDLANRRLLAIRHSRG